MKEIWNNITINPFFIILSIISIIYAIYDLGKNRWWLKRNYSWNKIPKYIKKMVNKIDRKKFSKIVNENDYYTKFTLEKSHYQFSVIMNDNISKEDKIFALDKIHFLTIRDLDFILYNSKIWKIHNLIYKINPSGAKDYEKQFILYINDLKCYYDKVWGKNSEAFNLDNLKSHNMINYYVIDYKRWLDISFDLLDNLYNKNFNYKLIKEIFDKHIGTNWVTENQKIMSKIWLIGVSNIIVESINKNS